MRGLWVGEKDGEELIYVWVEVRGLGRGKGLLG